MMPARTILATLIAATFAGPLQAQESGGFVVRLGRDTTSVERFTRTPKRVEVDQVGRVPKVLKRHFVYDYDAAGAVTRVTVTVTSPTAAPGAPVVQQLNATFTPDSMIMDVGRDTSWQHVHMGVRAGTVILAGSSPWVMYDAMTQRLAGQKADSLHRPAYFLGYPQPGGVTVRRLAADSVEIQTDNDRYHARIDRTGRILGSVPIRGTSQYSIDRVQAPDLTGYTASFLAREQKEGAMGALSTRDTVRASTGGATLWIDYGRPAKRGRVVFGGVVPWGEVWRTGANAATQFRTDKALQMGGTTVPAGFYTLWTIPSPGGWKLVINGETGQWGTEHKPARDLYTLDMSASTLAEPVERFTISVGTAPQGGTIQMDWDTTRASIPFTVKP